LSSGSGNWRPVSIKKTAAQDAEIDALKKQIAGTQANPAAIAASTNAVTPEQVKEQVKELSDKVDNVVEAQKKTLPGEFNPAIGLVGDMVFSYRDKGSDKPAVIGRRV